MMKTGIKAKNEKNCTIVQVLPTIITGSIPAFLRQCPVTIENRQQLVFMNITFIKFVQRTKVLWANRTVHIKLLVQG